MPVQRGAQGGEWSGRAAVAGGRPLPASTGRCAPAAAGRRAAAYLAWSALAGLGALAAGWTLALLLGAAVPVPRRYLSAVLMTALAVLAGWQAPAVVRRVLADRVPAAGRPR